MFRMQPKGAAYRKLRETFVCEFRDSVLGAVEMEVTYPTNLSVDHEDYLLALMALAGRMVPFDGGDAEIDGRLKVTRTRVETVDGGEAIFTKLAFRTCRGEILRMAGRPDSKHYFDDLVDKLRDLGAIEYRYRRIEGNAVMDRFGEKLVVVDFNQDTGDIDVYISDRFARLLFRKPDGDFPQYAALDFRTRLGFESGVAKLLHRFLCCSMRKGEARRFTLEQFVYQAYGPPAEGRSAMSNRRTDTRAALSEIASAPGWQASSDEDGKSYTIRRLKNDRTAPSATEAEWRPSAA